VDDNAQNRALAKATLDDEGVRVVVASSGEEAIAAFERERPDCVLLDIRMPGLDGIATCKRMRMLAGTDRTAIIFVTAQREVGAFDEAVAVGGDDFITKPFRPSELVGRIRTAMRLRRIAAEHGALSVELKRQRDELVRLQLQKEQLAAFLVHDLKNPVHVIELNAQRVLRNPAADARSRDSATKIHDTTRALMRMITNLLDIEKADAGQLAPTRVAVDVRELVGAAVAEMASAAAAVPVELAPTIDAASARIDRDLIHRVLVNLIENAIRHSAEGGTVAVTARTTAGAIELRVADSGLGVPEHRRATVFERFVTEGDASMRTNRGLGLAFCKIAVEAHAGQIWIEDAAPGAIFCVRISNVD
jgi:signal transduction histidine kinase